MMHINKKITVGLFILGFLGFFAPQVFALTAGEVQRMVDAGIIATNKITAARAMIDEADTRPAPTVSILIGGREEHTVRTGDTLPAVTWSSSATSTRNTYSIQLIPNNARYCGGITANQVWGPGSIASTAFPHGSGSFQLPGKALETWKDCDLTYKFIVKDVLGTEYTDTAVLKYRSKTAADTNSPTASILIGGQASTTVAVGQIPPAITWLGTNGNRFNTSYTVNDRRLCGFNSATTLKDGNGRAFANTISGTHTPRTPTTAARRGCVVTYKYEVSNTTTGEGPVAATAVLTYVESAITPTARIDVAGSQDVTVKAGDPAPNVTWTSANATAWRTVLDVNDERLCGGIKDNQVWLQGKSASGSATALAPTKNTVGCVLTLTYTASNTVAGTSADATTVIRYVDTTTTPTAELKIGGQSNYSVRIGDRLPVFTWAGTNATAFSASYTVADNRVCGDIPTAAQRTPQNITSLGTTASGSWQVPSTWKAPANRLGCVVTYRYKAVNPTTGKEATATAVLTYVAAGTTTTTATSTSTTGTNTRATRAGTQIIAQGINRNAMIQTPSGGVEKGVYKLDLQIIAADGDIYIPASASLQDLASAGFDIKITDTGTPFTGTKTANIIGAQALQSSNALVRVGDRFKIADGQIGIFAIIVELDPDTASANKPFGIELRKIKFSGTPTGSLSTEVLADREEYETDKLTIAQNTTESVITPTIAQGATGEKVSLVQQALKNAGYFTEEVTGYFGNVTKSAVAAFQQANALENIGAVGPKTAQLLNQFLTF
jgi:hypothetical protein